MDDLSTRTNISRCTVNIHVCVVRFSIITVVTLLVVLTLLLTESTETQETASLQLLSWSSILLIHLEDTCRL